MEEKIRNILLDIISTDSDLDPASIEINKETRLREDLGMNSFNLAELTVHIEDEFDVDIFESGIVNTVSEILEKIESSNA